MLSRHSSLSLLALLSCISFVVGGPIQSYGSLSTRSNDVLIGYRYVSQQKAAEYNYYGTLTAVGASGTQLGDGAYISPDINEWNVPNDYWQCMIFADATKFSGAERIYISQHANVFYSSTNLNNYLSRARLNPARTVLWSKISGDPQQHIQMLIPPYYLARSPGFGGAYGSGDLGIRVRCVPKSQQGTNYLGIANWGGDWRIPGYACDFFRKRDGSDSCPLPSPAGPIEIPSSFIPAPSGDISTVSSYSFSETPITATSTALPSGMSYFPSGVSSAVPPPVSGMSTGPILSVSSAFSFPSPIPSSSASGSASGAPGLSASVGSSASGHSSAVASLSVHASSAKSSAAASRPASSSASKPASSSKALSSVHSSATSAPAKSSVVKTSAKPTTTKPTTTKPATTKAATTPKPKGH
ncbi:hypothetical protein C8R44DRAFT_975124 [Mycena epipterygia]|nr:hypothetical protein C8R44DRAFT_975124 [Mycena epipterygia]